jgi:aminomethyltransferase
MASTSSHFRKSPLHDWHAQRGARMTAIEGLLAPIFYKTFEREKSFEREHGELRNGAGLLDFHSFEVLRAETPDAGRIFDNLFASEIRRGGGGASGSGNSLFEPETRRGGGEGAEGSVVQAFLCNDKGYLVDRLWLIVQERRATMVCTPGRGELVAAEFADAARSANVFIERASELFTVLALVGPMADDALARALKRKDFIMRPGDVSVVDIFTAKAVAARTEIAGLPAYLIITGSSYAPIVAERLLSMGQNVRPCGMAAFDTVRVESGEALPLFEAAEPVTPAELDLMDLVDRNKPFKGRDALLSAAAEGQGKWLAGVAMKENVIPRRGSTVLDAQGNRVGTLTSGVYSPKLNKGIGLAIVDRMAAFIGNQVGVVMHGRPFVGEIVSRPMIQKPGASQF